MKKGKYKFIDESGDVGFLEKSYQSFWSVIPTLLLENDKIPLRAKRLYGLIASLCKKRGYCWATNKFLAQETRIPLGTIRKYLKKLENQNWIRLEIELKEGNKRRIFLTLPDFYKRWVSKNGHRDMPTIKSKREHRYVHKHEQTRTDIDNNKDNNKNIRLAEPTKRKEIKFPKEDYERVLNKYQKLKGIELKGKEFDPIIQEIKTMFMSERKPEEIIACMDWMNEDEFYQNKWTIKTIRLKLPEYLSGNLEEEIDVPEYAK